MSKPKVLITGATRGLGLELAKQLHAEGYEVYGTSRNPTSSSGLDFMTLLRLDLSDSSTINELFLQLPEVDLLINNAGNSQIGSVEETTIDSIKSIFEVNLFNQILLTKKYIPIMRQKRKGTIINITSMAGTVPVPFSTIYASVKSAFDAFSKGLRNELSPFGIRVVAVAPFQMNTTLPQTLDFTNDSPYYSNIIVAKKARDKYLKNAEDPAYIARQIVKVIKQKNPPLHVAVGKGAFRKKWLIRHLPQNTIERISRRLFGQKN